MPEPVLKFEGSKDGAWCTLKIALDLLFNMVENVKKTKIAHKPV